MPIASVIWEAMRYCAPDPTPTWATDTVPESKQAFDLMMLAYEQHDEDRDWLLRQYPDQFVAYVGKKRIGPFKRYEDLIIELAKQCYDVDIAVIARNTPPICDQNVE